MFIDAHTHSTKTADFSFVMNKHAQGIHPWELTTDLTLEKLKANFLRLSFQNVFAIGECGLDRVHPGLMAIDDQIKVFKWHLEVASDLKKPLIIHCVRAYSDLLQIFKQLSALPIMLIHDFNGNEQQAIELSKYDVTFSLGKRMLCRPNGKSVLKLEHILLETDDQLDESIQNLYLLAGQAFNVDQTSLQRQMLNNFIKLFREAGNVSSPDFIDNFRS